MQEQNRAVSLLMEEWIHRLRGIGIPVSDAVKPEAVINARAKRRLGCCICKDGVYTIEVSKRLLNGTLYGENEMLQSTLIHELLHTCLGCGNHGAGWKQYARMAETAFGYVISRTTPVLEKAENETPKYLLSCTRCKALLPRYRLTAPVRHPGHYRCGKCGGQLKRIQ